MRAHAPQRPPARSDRRRTVVLAGLVAVTAIVGIVAWATRGDDAGIDDTDAPVPRDTGVATVPAGNLELAPPPRDTTATIEVEDVTATPPALDLPAVTTPTPAGTHAPSDTGAPSGSDAGGGDAAPPAGSANLDGTAPGLQAAFGAAADALAAEGIELIVNSGYRTPEHQRRLLDEAIAEYGSYEEARRWVFEPERSMHVQGLAVDVGSGPAADWLQKRGARFGICQTLTWEWWHFEWRQAWQDRGECPRPVDDPDAAPTVDTP